MQKILQFSIVSNHFNSIIISAVLAPNSYYSNQSPIIYSNIQFTIVAWYPLIMDFGKISSVIKISSLVNFKPIRVTPKVNWIYQTKSLLYYHSFPRICSSSAIWHQILHTINFNIFLYKIIVIIIRVSLQSTHQIFFDRILYLTIIYINPLFTKLYQMDGDYKLIPGQNTRVFGVRFFPYSFQNRFREFTLK